MTRQVNVATFEEGFLAETGVDPGSWAIGVENTPRWGNREYLSAIGWNDSLNLREEWMNPRFSTTGEASVVALLRTNGSTDATGDHSIFNFGNATSPAELYPYTDSKIYIGPFSATRWVSALVPSINIAVPHVVAATHRSGAQALYQNGLLVASATVSETPALDNAIRTGYLGALFFLAFWDRVLTPEEVVKITNDPYQIYAQEKKRAYKVPAAASGRIMSSLTRHGGLAGLGGIAGHGGGLAA